MQGRAFAGRHAREPREFQFGYRSRMDERLDLTRSVRWKNWVYIRNYMPHKTAGQFSATCTRPDDAGMEEANDAGQLAPEHARFFQPDAPRNCTTSKPIPPKSAIWWRSRQPGRPPQAPSGPATAGSAKLATSTYCLRRKCSDGRQTVLRTSWGTVRSCRSIRFWPPPTWPAIQPIRAGIAFLGC